MKRIFALAHLVNIAAAVPGGPIVSFRRILMMLALTAPALAGNDVAIELETIVSEVVANHMAEKRIPGISVAIVHEDRRVFSKGYGEASIEFSLPAGAETVYPISSVSKIFAGLLAVRLSEAGLLNLDSSIAEYLDGVPTDKQAITVSHLLRHTHGLEDFYRSDDYAAETGRSIDESTTEELLGWSLGQPLRSPPGDHWNYSLAGYMLLGKVLEKAGGSSYATLVDEHVLEPLGMSGTYGGSEKVVTGRLPILYELVDGELTGHVVDFPERVWPAGGLNLSVTEMARLFAALSGDGFLDRQAKQVLWQNAALPDGNDTNYGLGWTSYVTSQDRWVVGHEGGGASWVIYYPDAELAVIALSNMSGARADSLPYEIARAAFDKGIFTE
jgi:CubicO group peptidase (beta-lactamase class C family)